MKILNLLSALLLGFATQAASANVECFATFRKFDAQSELEKKTEAMPLTLKAANTVKFELQLTEEMYMSATIDTDTKSVLLMMVETPSTTTGNLTRASLTDGFARIARTEEIKESKVVCENAKDEDQSTCLNPKVQEFGTGIYTLHKVECYSR